MAQDASWKGGLGRTLLASQTAFLLGLDDDWTRGHVIPLFSDKDRQKFRQAWDGFLVWGRLTPALVEALMSAFIGGTEAVSHCMSASASASFSRPPDSNSGMLGYIAIGRIACRLSLSNWMRPRFGP